MAEVTLNIGGRQYAVNCRDGEESRLFALAALVDEKTALARRATPGLTEVRQLLFAALFLADELNDLRAEAENHRPAPPPAAETEALIAQAEAKAQARADAKLQDHIARQAALQADHEAMLTEHINQLTRRVELLTDRLAGSTIPA